MFRMHPRRQDSGVVPTFDAVCSLQAQYIVTRASLHSEMDERYIQYIHSNLTRNRLSINILYGSGFHVELRL